MDIEKIASKLKPLMPEKISKLMRARELSGPEMKSLIEKQIISTAYKTFGDFSSKILLSLPPENKAQGVINLGTILYDKEKYPIGISGTEFTQILNLTWKDVDFENQTVRFSPKQAGGNIIPWEPKDHENRVIPVPEQIIQLFADLQAESDERNPYVFIKTDRLNHILKRKKTGTWQSDFELINNLIRSVGVICRRAKVDSFTLHGLRRSCITNWAQKLPIQVVQQLAGHSNITTTRKYYLSVQSSDLKEARMIQSRILSN